jgi:phosphate transport system substrate-binding protein
MSEIPTESNSETVETSYSVCSLDEQNRPTAKTMPVIALCAIFCVAYFIFDFAFLFIVAFFSEFVLDKLKLNDSGLLIATVLYCFVVFLLFGGFGYVISKKTSRNWIKQIIIVLPVILLGLLIWYSSYSSTKEIKHQYGDLTWLFFSLYVPWVELVLDYLKDYMSDIGNLAYVRLVALFVPGLSFLSGIWVEKKLTKYVSKTKIKAAAAIIPGILVVCILASIWLPKLTMFTPNTYPKVDGATAGIPFGNVLIRELTGMSKRQAKETVKFNTTHDAYINLINKKADIIFVAGPSDEELKLAEQNDVKMKLTPIGKDAFIFLVHKDNSVDNLTVKQVQDIYSGKTTNWKEVGGQDTEIIAYQREKNSGSQTFMEKRVMKGVELIAAPKERKLDSMGGLIDTVADYKNAKNSIGYSFYYFANEMHKSENIKFLSIEEIECSKENIISEKYPFTAILYAVTREGEAADSSVSKMLAWILSKDGSKAIEEGGFVPISR